MNVHITNRTEPAIATVKMFCSYLLMTCKIKSNLPPKMQKSRKILACIGTGLLYGTVSSFLTFSNKALAAAHEYNFPLFVLFLQVLYVCALMDSRDLNKNILQMSSTQIALIGLHQARFLVYPRMTKATLQHHLTIAALYCTNAALALASLQRVSIPT